MNGFAVSALVLSSLSFVGSFYSYVVRSVAIGNPLHMWFHVLFPSGPVLIGLALVMGVTGLVTCRRHPSYRGKGIAVAALVLAGLALLHLVCLVVLARVASGYA